MSIHSNRGTGVSHSQKDLAISNIWPDYEGPSNSTAQYECTQKDRESLLPASELLIGAMLLQRTTPLSL